MRLLFSVRNPWYVRHYDSVLRRLASEGHSVDLVADGLGRAPLWPPHVEALVQAHPQIRLHWTPAPAGDTWYEFGTRLRQALYFLRFLEPEYAGMPMLLGRAEEKAPPIVRRLAGWPWLRAPAGIRWLQRVIRRWERAVPPNPRIAAFLRELAPDVVVVTPLIVLRTVQLDLVRAAAAAGIPTAFAVASWDHLSSKGVLWTVPDRVLVWNHIQQQEAVRLHGVPADRVRLTGAQLFDEWFAAPSARTREAFCRRVGLDPARPFILYTCSALFQGSPSEAEFVVRWVRAVRASGHPSLRDAGILVRPHPRRADEWKAIGLPAFGERVVLHPAAGAAPVDAVSRQDYFDSMRYAHAVVGINTSAMVEASILRRPVLTLLAPEFTANQEGTVHFRYLMDPDAGLLEVARTFDEHLDQLDAAVRRDGAPSERSERFVASFIRPLGRDVEATARVVDEVAALGRVAPLPSRVSAGDRWLRPWLYPLATLTARAMRRQARARAAEKQLRRNARKARESAIAS